MGATEAETANEIGTATPDDVQSTLMQVARVVGAADAALAAGEPALTFFQWTILAHLAEVETLTRGQIIKATGLPRPSAAATINSLAKAGLVSARVETVDEKPRQMVSITPTGLAAFDDADTMLASLAGALNTQHPKVRLQRGQRILRAMANASRKMNADVRKAAA